MVIVVKQSAVFLLILLIAAGAVAQPFSYVYIQGDKDMPFYVKMEGKMMPRYGKNYCILSELAPGAVHIEVLFQQHAFPPEKFTINVPPDGYRGFLLTRRDRQYELYDLQTKNYIGPGDEVK